MPIGKILGFLLLIVAAITFLRDALDWYDSGILQTLSGDQLWLSLAPDSYQAVQDWAVENLSVVWDPGATTILAAPAFVSSGVLGILVLLASRKKKKNTRRPGSNLRQIYG
ncbi:MAG TPA: hypothetical protein VN632_00735 [Stellaceae bacterium]|nr:hypothetical protein [Stellaceae bacterium]